MESQVTIPVLVAEIEDITDVDSEIDEPHGLPASSLLPVPMVAGERRDAMPTVYESEENGVNKECESSTEGRQDHVKDSDAGNYGDTCTTGDDGPSEGHVAEESLTQPFSDDETRLRAETTPSSVRSLTPVQSASSANIRCQMQGAPKSSVRKSQPIRLSLTLASKIQQQHSSDSLHEGNVLLRSDRSWTDGGLDNKGIDEEKSPNFIHSSISDIESQSEHDKSSSSSSVEDVNKLFANVPTQMGEDRMRLCPSVYASLDYTLQPEAESHVQHGTFSFVSQSLIELHRKMNIIRYQQNNSDGKIAALENLCQITLDRIKSFQRTLPPPPAKRSSLLVSSVHSGKFQPLASLQSKAGPPKKNNWRQKHEDFVNTIRAARGVQIAMDRGEPLPPPPPPTINPDYVQCEYCNRRFNETAAERHVKFCREQHNRLPSKKEPSDTAKRRAQARTEYKAPKLKGRTGGGTSASGYDYHDGSTNGYGHPPSQAASGTSHNRYSARTTPQKSAAGRYGAGGRTMNGGDSDRNLVSGRALRTGRTAETYNEARQLSATQRAQHPKYPATSHNNRNSPQTLSSPSSSHYGGASPSYSPATRTGPSRATVGGSTGKTPPSMGRVGSGTAKFCHECGTKFPVASAKFCIECGVKRSAVI